MSVPRLKAIPTGMVAWVRSVETSIRQLTAQMRSVEQSARRRMTTGQITTPAQLMRGDAVNGVLDASAASLTLTPTWASGPTFKSLDTDETYLADEKVGLQGDEVVLQSTGPVGITSGGSVTVTLSGDLKVDSLPSTGSAANVYYDVASKTLKYSTSSIRYKQDVYGMTPEEGLALIRALRPVTYRRRDAPSAGVLPGLIAEEVNAVPNGGRFVTRTADGVPDGVQYAALVVPLIAAVQALADAADAVDSEL